MILRLARRRHWQDAGKGGSPDEAVASVKNVLDSIGDTCPEFAQNKPLHESLDCSNRMAMDDVREAYVDAR